MLAAILPWPRFFVSGKVRKGTKRDETDLKETKLDEKAQKDAKIRDDQGKLP